jgi:hypothetical protein
MSFTTENGTGVTDANALITVAEFDTYLDDRGIESFTWIASEKQAAIITASVDFIDTFFTFYGTALTTTQGMQLPTDEVTINAQIKRACAMAAHLHLQSRLFVAPSDIQQRAVVSESSELEGVGSESFDYAEQATYTTKYPTTAIDRLLSAYSSVGGGLSGKLARVL